MESRCWCDLPNDMRSEVLSKLFLKDRCHFNLVCKSWNSTIPLPPALPPPRESPCFNSPCLIFSQTRKSSCKLFHSLYNDFYYLDFPADAAEILFSKDGWLLMSRENASLFLFNPFTRVKFELPPTPSPFFSVCFTSSPTSPGCFIFGIFLHDDNFGLIKFGDNKWQTGKIKDNHYDVKFWQTDCPPLLHNGVYYWLEYQKRNLRIFDLAEKYKYQWMGRYGHDGFEEGEDSSEEEEEEEGEEIMIEENGSDDIIEESYMLEVEGDIWGVFIKNDGQEVSVEKLDLSRMCWTKLETLGDKCVYVSTFGSFAETCANSELANKIYFNKFYDKSGVIYSLSTGMYYTAKGHVIPTQKIYGLTQVGHAAWIKPTL